MSHILLITASPYGAASRGARLAEHAAARLVAKHPGLAIVRRELPAIAPAAIPAGYSDALLAQMPPDTPAFALSEALIRELEGAAFVLIATPMHNYTVPATLKLWIDLVLRHGRSFASSAAGDKSGLLADRPTLVVVTAGGLVASPGRRQPDHLTGYLTDVLATIGIHDLRFAYLEGLVDPVRAAQATFDVDRQLAADPVFGEARGVTAWGLAKGGTLMQAEA